MLSRDEKYSLLFGNSNNNIPYNNIPLPIIFVTPLMDSGILFPVCEHYALLNLSSLLEYFTDYNNQNFGLHFFVQNFVVKCHEIF